MRLDWARYSAEDLVSQGGHRWRAGSRAEVDCPAELRLYTELPPYAEGQSGWEPYYAGLSFRGELALCYVELNRSPGRLNRVNSRVLFLPSDTASLWPALSALQDPALFVGNEPLDIPDVDVGNDTLFEDEVQRVIQAFVVARKQMVVYQTRDNARFLNALWQRLWPAGRQSLTFQRHFHPREVTATGNQPQLILVPRITPWDRDDRFLVANTQTPGPPIAVGAEFLGGLKQLRLYVNVQEFVQELPDADLSELQHGWGLLGNVPLTTGFLAQHMPQVIDRMATRIPHAAAQDLLVLTGVPDREGTLKAAISEWLRTSLDTGRSLPDDTWVDQITVAGDWLLAGIKSALGSAGHDARFARLLWPWLTFPSGRELLEVMDGAWEVHFIQTLSRTQRITPELIRWAESKRWWSLHALLVTRRDLDAGLNIVFKKTPPRALQDALGTVRNFVDDDALLQALAQSANDAAAPLASRIISSDRHLRTLIRAESGWWRQVWTSALPAFREPFDGLADPDAAARTLVAEHVELGNVPDALLHAMASHGVHFLERPDRATLWPRFPDQFLSNTVTAYLRSTADPGVPDSTLLRAIHDSGAEVRSPEAAIRLVLHLQDLQDDQARAVLRLLPDTFRHHIETIEARRPGFVSRLFAQRVQDIPDWALPLLSGELKLEWAALRGEKLSDDVWWGVAMRLIPDAVHEPPFAFWVSADGKANALEEKGSTRTRWVAALDVVRRTGHPSVLNLLDEILRSYPVSPLQHLRQTKR